MRRYGRLEFMAVVLLGMLLAAVLYASCGCSERRDRTYYITSPAPGDPPAAPGDSCDARHCKHWRHWKDGKHKRC